MNRFLLILCLFFQIAGAANDNDEERRAAVDHALAFAAELARLLETDEGPEWSYFTHITNEIEWYADNPGLAPELADLIQQDLRRIREETALQMNRQ